jgi:hypothetical protein
MVLTLKRNRIRESLAVFGFLAIAMVGCKNPIAVQAKSLQAEAVSPSLAISLPDLSVLSPNGNIDFGSVSVGSSCDVSLTLRNSGKNDLVIDVASIAVTVGNFSLNTPPPANIAPGGTGTFTLRLTPTAPGMVTATVTIPTNDLKNPVFLFSIRGTGITIGLTTGAVSAITYTSASSGGTVLTEGGSTVTARGICWGTSPNPTIANYKSTDIGGGTGSYTCSLTGLYPGTFYYVRAWATNSDGTAYGLSNSFTTLAATPPTTTTISAINAKTAVSGGTVFSDSGVTVSERGVCWSLSHNPTIADSKIASAATASYTSNLTGLAIATTYYVRAYATNQGGTVYGNELSLKTVGYIGPSGGYVFYDAGSVQTDATYGNWRYMEAASSVQATQNSVWWNGSAVNIAGAKGTGLGAGIANTAAIVVAQGAGSYAAKICDALTFGTHGESDWFLPSKSELDYMLSNIKENNIGTWPTWYYWSSSQTTSDGVYNSQTSFDGAVHLTSIVNRNTWAARRFQ